MSEQTPDIKKAPAAALALAEYARDRADEGGVTLLDLKQYVLSWIAGPGMRISTSEIVQRMIDSGILVKNGMLGDDIQYLPAENYREIAARNPPWQPGDI